MPSFELLEESSSRHLLPDGENGTAGEPVAGVPVVKGWMVVDDNRPGKQNADPHQAARRGRVQLVAPPFDSRVTLSSAIMPLAANQLIKARVVRHKYYLSTTFEFHVTFQDAERLCFTAKHSRLDRKAVTIKHEGHGRGVMRQRTYDGDGEWYAFHDEKCEQEMSACITTFGQTAPCTMDATVGDQKLVSRTARFDHRAGGFVLDFQGLVDTASCKNVQLVPKGGPNTFSNTRFILGRRSDGEFHVHFRQPFTCLQAFATALVVFVGHDVAVRGSREALG